MSTSSRDVFINCPFDRDYLPIYRAITFALYDLGFKPRTAQEVVDSGETRIQKIVKIIENCPYGVHDISAVKLSVNGLPRFNMPFELGIFLGCKYFGGVAHETKRCLILDSEPHQYDVSISDISGQDAEVHHNKPNLAIGEVRKFLASHSSELLPGGEEVWRRYRKFKVDLPKMCTAARLNAKNLTFGDFSNIIVAWLRRTLLAPRPKGAPGRSELIAQ